MLPQVTQIFRIQGFKVQVINLGTSPLPMWSPVQGEVKQMGLMLS